MAKQKKPEQIQARNFKMLLYPDCEQHVEVFDRLKKAYPEFIAILHDGNPDKKPHWHVAFTVGDKPKRLGTLATELGLLSDSGAADLQFLRVCDGRLDRYLVYLTHLDLPEKEQYAASCLFGSSSMLAAYGRAATRFMRNEFDMSDCVLACLDYIRGIDGVVTMSGFTRWICNTPYFKASSSPLVRACIDEHNQRIYDAYRKDYMERMEQGSERMQALLQYPSADPAPPDVNFDDLEGWEPL